MRTIEYLKRYGYDDYQIYLLLSCAPIQGHIAAVVDVSAEQVVGILQILTRDQIPNACTTLGLPVDIFDFDIMPLAEITKRDLGKCAR